MSNVHDTETPLVPQNGQRAARWAIGVVSATAGAIGGVLAAGMWLGTVRADLNSHLANPEIHVSRQQKEGVAQVVVDREVKPALAEIIRRLERLEDKVDAVQASQHQR